MLYGRSSGGKTLFTRVAARSTFGFEKMIRSGVFTAVRTLGLRKRLGAIPPDISKRMMTCPIDAAILENRSVAGQVARRIDDNHTGFPDLLTASSETLRELIAKSLGKAPAWARSLSFHDNFSIRHHKFSEQLTQIQLLGRYASPTWCGWTWKAG